MRDAGGSRLKLSDARLLLSRTCMRAKFTQNAANRYTTSDLRPQTSASAPFAYLPTQFPAIFAYSCGSASHGQFG